MQFAYTGLILSAETIAYPQELTVPCNVRNTGTVPSSEVVQPYVGD